MTPSPSRRRRAAAAAAFLLALSACSGTSDGTGTTSPSAGATPMTESTPSALRVVDAAALQTLVDQAIRDWLIPGAVVLVRTPQGDVAVGAGTAELGQQQTPDVGTHFRIASNTKTMTSAVILQLAQEGKLDLQDPVSTYVAGVPGGDGITVAQLLEMRTGLYNYTNSPIIAESLDNDPSRVWQPPELLDIAFAQPVNFAPGAEFEYSNTNYVLLGMIIEQVDGRSLADSYQARLFGPLGMTDTALPTGSDTTIPEPFAHGYQYGSSSVALSGEPEYTPEQITAAHDGTWLPTDFTGVNHSFAFAAGGVVSTAGDLATWMDALVGGKVLDPEYQKLWADSPQPENPDAPAGQWYGYGITRQTIGDVTLTFHGGETAGYNSFMGVDAANGVTLVVWANQPVDVDTMKQTANSLMVKVLDLIYVNPPGAASSTAPAQAAGFEESTCPTPNLPGVPTYDFPSTMSCGYLTVPENRSRPDGRAIRIFVAKAPATSATPAADPLLVLVGGPGGAGSISYAGMVRDGINADRDVYFVDQRGTLHSDPLLNCPEFDTVGNELVSMPFTSDAATAKDLVAVQACHDRWAAAGVDLSAYNTAENAADIADLRVGLGVENWDVYGVSYGSKLAAVLLRDHPDGIRSVVLDSVSPPNLNIVENWWSAPAGSFHGIFAACAAQPACAAAYPNLETDFYDTVTRLTSAPAVVQTTGPDGDPLSLTIDGFVLAYAVIMATERHDASGVPKMIADAAAGTYDDVVAATVEYMTPAPVIGVGGHGLAFGVFCAESADLTTEAATLAHAKSVLPQFPDQVLKVQPKQGRLFTECPAWDVPPAEPSMMDPVVSDVPVLIMEGDFDAATAPQWVDLVTPGLSRSQVVHFPFTGHSTLNKSACAQDVMNAFLKDPTQQVDSSCTASMQLTFTTS